MGNEDDTRPPPVPEGWQPDPSVPHQERWWTGTEWGPQTRPAPESLGDASAPSPDAADTTPEPPATGELTPKQKQAKEASDGKKGCLVLIVLAILMAILIATCGDDGEGTGGGGGSGGAGTDTATDTEAFVMCQQFVRDRLKAPASAGFPLSYEATITGGPTLWTVRSHVDSENSFGAQIRTRFTCSVNYEGGDRWELRNLVFDE